MARFTDLLKQLQEGRGPRNPRRRVAKPVPSRLGFPALPDVKQQGKPVTLQKLLDDARKPTNDKSPTRVAGQMLRAKQEINKANPDTLRVNLTGNSRFGKRFTEIKTDKGVIHKYQDGTRVFVADKNRKRKG